MKSKILLLVLLTLEFGITNTNAQIKHRAQNQQQRIRQGVKSGEVTKAEARNLRSNQKDVQQDIKEANYDSKVTNAKKKDLKRDERKNSRQIYRKKHNERERK